MPVLRAFSRDGPDALRVGDRGTAEHQGAHHGDRADGGVRPTAGGAGAPDDGHARPANVGDVVAQRLEQRPDGRRRHLALHRELGGWPAAAGLGVVLGEPDLAGHVGHRDVGELGEQEHLALGDRQLGERVEGRADAGGRACGRGGRSGPSGGAARAARPAAGPRPPGSSSRHTLRQWCHAATNASRTALREAGRSPVRAKVCWSSEVRVDL
jgi:hypothetical protein